MKVTISGGKPGMIVSPNPVTGNQMILANMVKGIFTVNSFNTPGQKVYSGLVTSEGGSFTQSVRLLSIVTAGDYTLSLPMVQI